MREIIIILFNESHSVSETFEIHSSRSLYLPRRYTRGTGKRKIGQSEKTISRRHHPGNSCAFAEECSSVFEGRNEYRNNVSMGMTRRSFYLSNLRSESRSECGENGESSEGDAKSRAEKERKYRRRRSRRGRAGADDVDDGDTIHRSRSAASTRSVPPLRPRASRTSIYLPYFLPSFRDGSSVISLAPSRRPGVELRRVRTREMRFPLIPRCVHAFEMSPVGPDNLRSRHHDMTNR